MEIPHFWTREMTTVCHLNVHVPLFAMLGAWQFQNSIIYFFLIFLLFPLPPPCLFPCHCGFHLARQINMMHDFVSHVQKMYTHICFQISFWLKTNSKPGNHAVFYIRLMSFRDMQHCAQRYNSTFGAHFKPRVSYQQKHDNWGNLNANFFAYDCRGKKQFARTKLRSPRKKWS